MKIHDEYSHVNPNTIFRRMTVLKKSVAELQNFFEFELAPSLLSIEGEDGERSANQYLMTYFLLQLILYISIQLVMRLMVDF